MHGKTSQEYSDLEMTRHITSTRLVSVETKGQLLLFDLEGNLHDWVRVATWVENDIWSSKTPLMFSALSSGGVIQMITKHCQEQVWDFWWYKRLLKVPEKLGSWGLMAVLLIQQEEATRRFLVTVTRVGFCGVCCFEAKFVRIIGHSTSP